MYRFTTSHSLTGGEEQRPVGTVRAGWHHPSTCCFLRAVGDPEQLGSPSSSPGHTWPVPQPAEHLTNDIRCRSHKPRLTMSHKPCVSFLCPQPCSQPRPPCPLVCWFCQKRGLVVRTFLILHKEQWLLDVLFISLLRHLWFPQRLCWRITK